MIKCLNRVALSCMLGCICIPMSSGAADTPARDKSILGASAFSIPTNLRASWDLLQSISDGKPVMSPADGIAPETAVKEKNRTRYWIDQIISICPDRSDEVILVRSINGKDDGAYVSYSRHGYRMAIVDGRDMRILIHKPGMNRLTTDYLASYLLRNQSHLDLVKYHRLLAREFKSMLDGLDAGKTFFSSSSNEYRDTLKDAPYLIRYQMYDDLRKEKVRPIDEIIVAPGKSYGEIPDDRERWQKQLVHHIKWYRDGDSILFVIQKQFYTIGGKVPYPSYSIVGGIAYDDTRPMKRFDNPNVDDLFKQYADKNLQQSDRRHRFHNGR